MSTTEPSLTSEYAILTPLQVRIDTHARHSEHPDDPVATVLATLALTGSEDLADIGCGDGRFLARLAEHGHRGRLVGLDNSTAMVTAADALPGVDAVVGDAESLPFADDEFDAVTARHMLYHLPDPNQALRELQRITRVGGRVAVSVNHPATCARTRQLIIDRATEYGLSPAADMVNHVNSRTLPTMMSMSTVFGDVRIHQHDNALIFDAPEPLTRFAEALFSFCGVDAASPHRAAILDAVTGDIRDWFTTHPGQCWRDPKGYIVATAAVQ
ncbi:methyltransferase domain-containing protein [Nocardia cyriacigeorgica]|uniref:class I SAM-dependent methyltransferase n=1 Tax=Nocardia cyriacigeorgica TaxID=135487 RepID=UPI001894B84D|nr:class I SAM-dependent methyltransferase [Nocardia cyriacigeorgica]MBF6399474.1 methyltransferase domain-containing protein [Nocardia cyriacigeorgica]MBF6405104.1 methyltransferase domain-containing protein [Nocardia cyriacigeorgica]